jgi:hypothetical protein
MARRASRKVSTLGRQTSELSFAAPYVVARRLARMTRAGPVLNSRDRKEFVGMVAEKQLAFAQSWFAMLTEGARISQQLTLSAWRATAWPWSSNATSLAAQVRRAQQSGIAVVSKGLAPIHRKAVSNARRLSRTRTM